MTQNGVLQTDDNDKPVMGGTSSTDNATVINSAFDPVTRRLLVDTAGGGGTGTYYSVTGAINGSNVTFTIAVEVGSDFLLFLARQPQMLTTDFTYVAAAGSTTITYVSAPDASLNGQPHVAYVVS